MMTSVIALNALNFFMADVRDGFGPFLVQGKSWSPEEIGLVMTIGGYAGVIAIRGGEYLGAKPRRVVHHNKLGRPMSQMGHFGTGQAQQWVPPCRLCPESGRKNGALASTSMGLCGRRVP